MYAPGSSNTSPTRRVAAMVPPEPAIDDETLECYADAFAHMRINDEVRARAGDMRGLLATASTTISHLSSRFVTEPHVDFSGGWTFQLQNLWHLYYVTAKYCPENLIAPVILQLIETSHRGLLARTVMGANGVIETEYASVIVRDGAHLLTQYIWRDMPFLVPDMTNYWIQDCATMGRSQRVRISSFWASLVSASSAPWSYGLCRIALLVLRDTLETQRNLVQDNPEPGSEESENLGRTIDMLTISDLLLSVNVWLMRAGGRIAQLCEEGDGLTVTGLGMAVPEEIAQLGPLAIAAGIQPVPNGFSTQRWFFWLRRLDEIGAEASPQESKSVRTSAFVQSIGRERQVARRVANNMIYTSSQCTSAIVQELSRMGRLPVATRPELGG